MGGNGGGGGGDGVTVVGRAEIDMRAPFRSVKEAVVLFGEKETPLLAGDGDVHGPGLHRLRLMVTDICFLHQEIKRMVKMWVIYYMFSQEKCCTTPFKFTLWPLYFNHFFLT